MINWNHEELRRMGIQRDIDIPTKKPPISQVLNKKVKPQMVIGGENPLMIQSINIK